MAIRKKGGGATPRVSKDVYQKYVFDVYATVTLTLCDEYFVVYKGGTLHYHFGTLLYILIQ